MNNAAFWDLTRCESFKNRRFRRTYTSSRHSDKNWRFRKKVGNSTLRRNTNYSCHPDCGDTFLCNVGPYKIHVITSQKTALLLA
jgi:hypothetical protein